MTGEPLLRIDDLSGGYGAGIVLRGLSETVAASEVVFVLGRNGVGKSTLMKLVMGFLSPAAGHLHFRGSDIAGLLPYQRAAAGIAYAPQERVVFDDLTVAENLTLMRPTRALTPFEPYFAAFPRLKERLGQHAGTLSGGEKKLLSLTRALSENHALVLLDEPTEGVQFEHVMTMARLIAEQKQRGVGFLIVEQNLTLVEAIADRLMVLDHGDVVLQDAAAAVSRDQIISHLTV
ncbi:MAG: ATP-binding cassette domain-containing protein [Pseudolabrys sp.]